MDSKTKFKLWGTLSVQEMALKQKGKDGSGVPGYHFDPEVRFNFSNKEFKMSKGKAMRYLDLLQREKQKIPSPDKYAHLNLHFNDIHKKSLIYTSDRKFYFNDLIRSAK